MQTITTIGLDIAKSVFQVHGVDAEGKVIIRQTAQDLNPWAKPIRRSPSPSNYGAKSLIRLVTNPMNLRYPRIYAQTLANSDRNDQWYHADQEPAQARPSVRLQRRDC
jgi:hypothetical protein